MSRPPLPFVILVVALLLAGCASPATEEPPGTEVPPGKGGDPPPVTVGAERLEAGAPPAPTGDGSFLSQVLFSPCGGQAGLAGLIVCFEPNVAVDLNGTVYATNGGGALLAASTDGGLTWEYRAGPPMPDSAVPFTLSKGTQYSDSLLQTAPGGSLYFSAMVVNYALDGLVVARSEDGGRTWPVATFVSLYTGNDDPANGADRQWLAFGPGGTVYLTYSSPASGLWFAASEDHGRTFSGFQRVAPVESRGIIGLHGFTIVTSTGRLAFPAFACKGPEDLPDPTCLVDQEEADAGEINRVQIYSSTDGGKTWGITDAYVAPPDTGAGDAFPFLAVDGARLLLAWRGGGQEVFTSVSEDDGKTWSPPAAWTAPGERTGAAPWIVPTGNGTVAVAWYAVLAAGGHDLVVAHGDPLTGAQTERRVVTAGIPPGPDAARPASTDFASFVRVPDGRLVLTWAQDAEHLLVAAQASG